MKLQDFSSVVQLGIGFHAGTAFFQSVVELAGTPLSRRLTRLAKIAEIRKHRNRSYEAYHERACDLIADLEIKKIQFFNEFKRVVSINAGVALALCAVLVWISTDAEEIIPVWAAIFLIGLSLLPASISLLALWSRWLSGTKSLNQKIQTLDRDMT